MAIRKFSTYCRGTYTRWVLRADIDERLNNITIPAPFDSIVEKIRKVSTAQGFKTYIVGGFVRDILLGRTPKDLDLMVEGQDGGIKLAQAVAEEYDLHEPVIFPKFGTAKVELDGEDIEFVMPRKEYYSPETRKPKTDLGTIEQDAMRRDFGINALFLDIDTMDVKDLTGHGIEDLKNRVIRVTDEDNAEIIFSQDPLRMLRAIRQALQLGFEIAPETEQAIKDQAKRLDIVSTERIRDELSKILTTKTPSKGIRFLRDTGIMKYVMPELEELDVGQETEYHNKNVFEHTMQVLDQIPDDLVLRLSALLHDIGKPATKEVIDETVHFLEHQNVGAEMASEILKRLKFPNEITDRVSGLVEKHMRPHGYSKVWTDSAVRRFVRDMGDYLDDVLDLAEADITSMNPEKVEELKGINKELRERIEHVQEEQKVSEIPELLDGFELQEMFGKGPGPWIKKVKDYINDRQMENPNLTKDEAKELARQFMEKQGSIRCAALTVWHGTTCEIAERIVNMGFDLYAPRKSDVGDFGWGIYTHLYKPMPQAYGNCLLKVRIRSGANIANIKDPYDENGNTDFHKLVWGLGQMITVTGEDRENAAKWVSEQMMEMGYDAMRWLGEGEMVIYNPDIIESVEYDSYHEKGEWKPITEFPPYKCEVCGAPITWSGICYDCVNRKTPESREMLKGENNG